MTEPPSGPGNGGQKEKRARALTVKIVAALIVLYIIAVVGTFIYDHLL